MIRTVDRDNLFVAKRVGTNLYLSATPKSPVNYGPLSETTIFFTDKKADEELKHLRIDPRDVSLIPARMHAEVGVR